MGSWSNGQSYILKFVKIHIILCLYLLGEMKQNTKKNLNKQMHEQNWSQIPEPAAESRMRADLGRKF